LQYLSVDKLDFKLKKAILGWDVVNWVKALRYWEDKCDLYNKNYQCLELGSGNTTGGLSLWLAMNRNNVICSDKKSPRDFIYPIHQKYNCDHRIEYASIDVLSIPYDSYFDIVAFKSVLGGISRENNSNKKVVIDNIYRTLKPRGKLFIAENLEAAWLHRFARKKILKKTWNYLIISEMDYIFNQYRSFDYTVVGFLGAFGRDENQRMLLGYADNIIEKLLPAKMKYILIGIAQK